MDLLWHVGSPDQLFKTAVPEQLGTCLQAQNNQSVTYLEVSSRFKKLSLTIDHFFKQNILPTTNKG